MDFQLPFDPSLTIGITSFNIKPFCGCESIRKSGRPIYFHVSGQRFPDSASN